MKAFWLFAPTTFLWQPRRDVWIAAPDTAIKCVTFQNSFRASGVWRIGAQHRDFQVSLPHFPGNAVKNMKMRSHTQTTMSADTGPLRNKNKPKLRRTGRFVKFVTSSLMARSFGNNSTGTVNKTHFCWRWMNFWAICIDTSNETSFNGNSQFQRSESYSDKFFS